MAGYASSARSPRQPYPPDGGKRSGVTLHHFGGFVDAARWENEYLWGRLDAAELGLRMLRSSAPGQTQVTPTTLYQPAEMAGEQLRPDLRRSRAAGAGRLTGPWRHRVSGERR